MNLQLLLGLSILSGASLVGCYLLWRSHRSNRTPSPPEAPSDDVKPALGDDISAIYAEAYEEAGRVVRETQQKTEHHFQAEVEQLDQSLSALGTEAGQTFSDVQAEVRTFFGTALAKAKEEISTAGTLWQAEIAEATHSLKSLIAETAQSIETSQTEANAFLKSIHEEAQVIQTKNAEIHRALEDQRQAIIATAEADAARIRDKAEKESAHFLEMSQESFNQQLAQIKQASEQQISGATEKLMEQLGQETSMTINQIKKIVSQTQYQSWEKIEGFNHQILEKFEQITDHVINQGEARAKSIGEKVLVQIEDEIVLFVIGIIKETLNLKLTPEEHQEIIMQAVAKLKAEHARKAAEIDVAPSPAHRTVATPHTKSSQPSKSAESAVPKTESPAPIARFANIESPYFKIAEEGTSSMSPTPLPAEATTGAETSSDATVESHA